ncbi:MAG: DegT/DnrJ/EryC1/StrS family aminotransferase [Candidatus Acidiferrum sp.]
MKMAQAQELAAQKKMIVQVEPWIDDSELRELRRVIESTFLVEHQMTREFEQQTAALTGARHAVAVCNGSMALYVCLKALGIGADDEVIVPNLTFIASSNAVILAGATPVLCEVREDTFCIDVEHAEKLVTERTKAVMPVHLYGQSADMTAVMAFAKRHGLKVIEDGAEAIGVLFEGRHAGTFGDMGILSYYGNKTITCGEGGMVLTGNEELAKAAYQLKNYGRERKGQFLHETIGFNFSFTDLHAAIGVAQMRKLPGVIEKKRQIRSRYVEALAGVEQFLPVFIDPRCAPVFWFTSFLCPDPRALSAFLQERNIQTRRFFYPLHRQPCYQDGQHVRVAGAEFSVSDAIYEQGISLPSSYGLREDEQAHVIACIREFYARRH